MEKNSEGKAWRERYTRRHPMSISISKESRQLMEQYCASTGMNTSRAIDAAIQHFFQGGKDPIPAG